MIVTVFFIAIIALCALIGSQLKFFKSALAAFNLAIAVYFALWLLPHCGAITRQLPAEFAPWADLFSCGTILLLTAPLLAALESLICKQYPQITAHYELNELPLLDTFAGLFAGGLSGYLLAGFIFTALSLTPVTVKALGSHADAVAQRGFCSVTVASRTIDSFNSNSRHLALTRYDFLDAKRAAIRKNIADDAVINAPPEAAEPEKTPSKKSDSTVIDL